MSLRTTKAIFPYDWVIGQDDLKLALEIAYLSPSIGGVLISGHRGTGKSTSVRAFAKMLYGRLPYTLPINATEDRVIGGWNIDQLMQKEVKWKRGLLEEAKNKLLYIDEINLLDDHIINIILDVTSTGVLVVQREGQNFAKTNISFTLVGTMNPEEGGLRPQLLDRFGLMVEIKSEEEMLRRIQILSKVYQFDQALYQLKHQQPAPELEEAWLRDKDQRLKLVEARERVHKIEVSPLIMEACVEVARHFQAEGHRGDYVMALASRACAAREQADKVERDHLIRVAPLAFSHRRHDIEQTDHFQWDKSKDDSAVAEIIDKVLQKQNA